MKVRVKKLTATDIVAVSLWFNNLVVEDSGIVEDFQVNPHHNPFLENQITLVNEGKLISLIARVDKKVVAKADIKPLTRKADQHVGEVSFGVLKGFKQAGIELLQAAVTAAKDFKLQLLIYYILSSNQYFISLIQKAGFQKVGTIRHYYRIKGQNIDRVIFEKRLGS